MEIRYGIWAWNLSIEFWYGFQIWNLGIELGHEFQVWNYTAITNQLQGSSQTAVKLNHMSL